MSICPFATSKLLPESKTQGKITPRAVIMHSAAGRGSLYRFFLGSSSLESHFWVGEDGRIEQYIDTNVRADANRNANTFGISIETESSSSATEPWNPTQFRAIEKLVTWCCDQHGIPKRKITDPYGSGIGWHIQFGAPGPWTPVSKSCPGPARIKQMPELINFVAYSPPKPPIDPNAGRKWKAFAKNVTDKKIFEAGGLNNQVAELQMLLKSLGYYKGAITGNYFADTVKAWVAFKKDQAKLSPKDKRWKDLTSAVQSAQIASLRWWVAQKK